MQFWVQIGETGQHRQAGPAVSERKKRKEKEKGKRKRALAHGSGFSLNLTSGTRVQRLWPT